MTRPREIRTHDLCLRRQHPPPQGLVKVHLPAAWRRQRALTRGRTKTNPRGWSPVSFGCRECTKRAPATIFPHTSFGKCSSPNIAFSRPVIVTTMPPGTRCTATLSINSRSAATPSLSPLSPPGRERGLQLLDLPLVTSEHAGMQCNNLVGGWQPCNLNLVLRAFLHESYRVGRCPLSGVTAA